jgi:dihydrofolate synthase/folylpolyglutamate synthase
MGETCTRAKKRNKRLPTTVTFFEWTTALAFFCFARAKVDVAVMETGMGGRFDATNVVDPLVSVITSISIDHSAFLGKKLADIAFEKSGIIKKGRPVVCGAVSISAAGVIRNTARKRRSKFYLFGTDFKVNSDGEFVSELTGPPKIEPSMDGGHQIHNASLAVQALLVTKKFDVSSAQFSRGIKKTKLPGRFQVERQGGRSVIYDVAHNPSAVKTLVCLLKEKYPKKKFDIIFGALRGKNILAMLRELAPVTKNMLCVTTGDFRAADSGTVALLAKKAGIKAKQADGEEIAEFLAAPGGATRGALGTTPLLATGSFTTVELVMKSKHP